jgi:hypothetical protein
MVHYYSHMRYPTGSQDCVTDALQLQQHGITHVLNLVPDLQPHYPEVLRSTVAPQSQRLTRCDISYFSISQCRCSTSKKQIYLLSAAVFGVDPHWACSRSVCGTSPWVTINMRCFRWGRGALQCRRVPFSECDSGRTDAERALVPRPSTRAPQSDTRRDSAQQRLLATTRAL